jgi:hypothetical protein
MTHLRLEKYLGEWYIINVSSSKIITSTTKETKLLLKQMTSTHKNKFTLEVI